MNWEEWRNKLKSLYDEAIKASDNDLLSQNLESCYTSTVLVLQLDSLIKPDVYEISFDD